MPQDKRPSEFGGTPGRVQRPPTGEQVLTAAQAARLARATEPTDPGDSADAALVREWEMEGRL